MLAARQVVMLRGALAKRTLTTSAALSQGLLKPSLAAKTEQAVRSANATPPPALQQKAEGTIASVFASLSGEDMTQSLPPRFAELKRSLIQSPEHAAALQHAFGEVLLSLQAELDVIVREGAKTIPKVQYPGDEVATSQPLESWIGAAELGEIKKRGTMIVKNVVSKTQVQSWVEEVKQYVRDNPSVKGFPVDKPAVYELYWTKAQLAARGHPSLLTASKALLSLFHAPAQKANRVLDESLIASLGNPLSYVDRLRMRPPGDAAFALGPHIDGGGVERWECDKLFACFSDIFKPVGTTSAWRQHDSWSLGPNSERLTARTDMYDGPGQCAIYRPLQGWLAASTTAPGEGTLRVLPLLREASAYIMLRPFFKPVRTGSHDNPAYLARENWELDWGSTSDFPGCTLGRNIELTTTSHPHLRLDESMTSIPQVEEGDFVLWHCDAVHAVESQHTGSRDSSVFYIPAVPTTLKNFEYILKQRQCFEAGVAPPDFPGGKGESEIEHRGQSSDVKDSLARRAIGLEKFGVEAASTKPEQALLHKLNSML